VAEGNIDAPVFAAGLFAGRHLLVTGGGTGIGFAIAKEFAALGARVMIAAGGGVGRGLSLLARRRLCHRHRAGGRWRRRANQPADAGVAGFY
jgi:NAD(P)-dependent dehydrogenase (short-subunit alcohol dehydrogenase family)